MGALGVWQRWGRAGGGGGGGSRPPPHPGGHPGGRSMSGGDCRRWWNGLWKILSEVISLLCTMCCQPETRSPKNPKPETRNPKPWRLNPKPEIRIPKLETSNQCRHQISNQKLIPHPNVAKRGRFSVSGSEAGSFLRRMDSCITQLEVQGPSRTCYDGKEDEEEEVEG